MDPPSRASGRPTVVSATNRVTMRRYARQLRALLASRGPLRIAQTALEWLRVTLLHPGGSGSARCGAHDGDTRSESGGRYHRLASGSVEFSRELRDDVLAGDITVSVRLWKRPHVREGGRYRVGPGVIEVDAIELVPFAAITEADVRQAGEPDRETLRRRAAHAGPIDEDTFVYRIEFHAVNPETELGRSG
jgi:hypothetical protein